MLLPNDIAVPVIGAVANTAADDRPANFWNRI